MTAAELRQKLSLIEPTDSMYQGITEADVPALAQLTADTEDWVAGRAVFALSRVASREAVAALSRAGGDSRSAVRVAVAAAVGQSAIVLPDDVVLRLLQDRDLGVRKFAPQAVKPQNGRELKTTLNRLASDDAVRAVRESATEALRRLR